jgi:hypothetical protein
VQGRVRGNAGAWFGSGQAAGLPTSATPAPGDIAVFGNAFPGSGGAGHVALVTAVSGGVFSVDEGNVKGVDVASAGQYSTTNPYLEGFLVPPAGADPTLSLLAAYTETTVGDPAVPADLTTTQPTPAPGATSTGSAGAVLAANAVSGLSSVVDSLQSWFDTPRLIGFGVAAVVLYMGWSSTLDGGPAAAV